jgi:hypothetical protein
MHDHAAVYLNESPGLPIYESQMPTWAYRKPGMIPVAELGWSSLHRRYQGVVKATNPL